VNRKKVRLERGGTNNESAKISDRDR